MKRFWQKLVTRIDAMTLRERCMVFAVVALVLLTLVNSLLLDPLFAKQKKLSAQISQDENQIEGIGAEISMKLAQLAVDPDEPSRRRIAQLKLQVQDKQQQLSAMQKGLISPDKMVTVLEQILQRNGRLRLRSLTTLPTTNLLDTAEAAGAVAAAAKPDASRADAAKTAPAPAKALVNGKPAAASGGAVYRHGVEIVVEGSYVDMQAYLTALEAMPWQLFWGKAELKADEYPHVTLSLTLYTMSLDNKWLNL